MASISAQLNVTTSAPVLLWQTTTGVSPDPAVNTAGQIFRAQPPADPVPILVVNTDSTNPVYLGGSGVTSSTGTKLAGGLSITRSVVGNDSQYAISTGGTVVVAVLVDRQ
jgi:hypothetical protein